MPLAHEVAGALSSEHMNVAVSSAWNVNVAVREFTSAAGPESRIVFGSVVSMLITNDAAPFPTLLAPSVPLTVNWYVPLARFEYTFGETHDVSVG